MLNTNWLKISVLSIMVLLLAATPCLALKRVVPETTREAIVEKYLKGRPLDAVEGIWSLTVNTFYGELAIIKVSSPEYPGWEYMGVVINDGSPFGKIGEAKIVLKKTAAQGVYTGFYIVQAQVSWGIQTGQATNFVMSQPHIIQTVVPSLGPINFIRIDNINSGSGVTGASASGTGFFVTSTHVVTNYHVIADAKRVEITFQNDFTLSAKVVGKDESNDVAVLLVEGLESKVKPLSLGRTNNMKEGEKVFTVGFPLSNDLGTRHKISDGMINGLTGLKDDPTVFQISIPIQPGNSGGPLISDDGRVIGITSSGLNSVYYLRKIGTVPQNVNFAVKSDYIMPVLDIVGSKVDRIDRQDKALDPVTIMDLAKVAVVYIKAYRE